MASPEKPNRVLPRKRAEARGIVRIGERKIHKKRIVRALFDVFHRLFRIARGQDVPVSIRFQDRLVPDERKRLHVDAVGNAEVGIEATAGRQVCRLVTQMPLPNGLGLVAAIMKKIGQQGFIERCPGF